MDVLLGRGIDPNMSRYGQTALHFAAAYRGNVSDADRARFAAMLLDHGARLDMRDDLLKSTPLGWACRWGRKKLAELLIARGAPIDEPDAEPWATPKAWAKRWGRMRFWWRWRANLRLALRHSFRREESQRLQLRVVFEIGLHLRTRGLEGRARADFARWGKRAKPQWHVRHPVHGNVGQRPKQKLTRSLNAPGPADIRRVL